MCYVFQIDIDKKNLNLLVVTYHLPTKLIFFLKALIWTFFFDIMVINLLEISVIKNGLMHESLRLFNSCSFFFFWWINILLWLTGSGTRNSGLWCVNFCCDYESTTDNMCAKIKLRREKKKWVLRERKIKIERNLFIGTKFPFCAFFFRF